MQVLSLLIAVLDPRYRCRISDSCRRIDGCRHHNALTAHVGKR
jgi:hypothetical protein